MTGAVETGKVEKVVKEKKPTVTNILVGVTEEHLAKFKGKSAEIAKLLADGLSKSEVLKHYQEIEAKEGLADGAKPMTHQTIYQVYKRLKSMDGVTLGTKEMTITRAPKAKVEKAEKAEKVEKVDTKAELAEAAGETEVVEG